MAIMQFIQENIKTESFGESFFMNSFQM